MISRRSLLMLPAVGFLGTASAGSLSNTSQVPLHVWITYSRGTDLEHGFRRVAMLPFHINTDMLVLSRVDIWPNQTDGQSMMLRHISFLRTGQFLPVVKYSINATMYAGSVLTLIRGNPPGYVLTPPRSLHAAFVQ